MSRKMRNAPLLARLATAIAIGFGGSVAYGQDDDTERAGKRANGMEEIVVTARMRSEDIQDVGASISVLSADTIAREGILDFEDIARRTVGLEVIGRGRNQNDVGMRGISNGFLQGLSDTGIAGALVSQYLDDVQISQATASQRDFNYFDFERVEVLRGPQPTYFGEGSVGGTIRYVTRGPDLSGDTISDSIVRASASSTKDGDVNEALSAATTFVIVPERLGIRAVINQQNNSGFIDNPTLGERNINDDRSTGGRVVLLSRPNDHLSFRLTAMIERDRIGATYDVDPTADGRDDLEVNFPVDGKVKDDFDLYSAKADYTFDSITVSSITGYYKRDSSKQAYDASSALGWGRFLPEPLTASTATIIDDKAVSEELRFVSSFDGPLNFIAGLLYQDSELNSRADTTAPEFGDFVVSPPGSDVLWQQYNTIDTRQYSGFAEVTYRATDKLRLIAGARYVDEKLDNKTDLSTQAVGSGPSRFEPPFALVNVNNLVSAAGLSNSATFDLEKWLPRGGIEYDLRPNLMLYASASSGVRNGNLNPSSSAFVLSRGNPTLFEQVRVFSEDKVLSIEAGAKTRWNDDLIVNVAVYGTSYEDPQVPENVPLVLAVNGPDERILGAEIEMQWQVNSYVHLDISGAYQDAKFQGNQLLSANTLALGFPYDLRDGNWATNTPQWSFSSGADIRYPIGDSDVSGVAFIGYQYIGSRYTTVQNFPASKLAPMNVVNVRFGVESGNWSAILYAANATNEVEFQSIRGTTSRPIVNSAGKLDFIPGNVTVNRPRTIGLQATLYF
jgi:outer membrane receptor protein involved in Fe transport